MANVFLTGASGFMGRGLAGELLRRGHLVRGLVRKGSGSKLVKGCKAAVRAASDAGIRHFIYVERGPSGADHARLH